VLKDDLTSLNETKLSVHSSKWSNAMKDELKSMKDNDVWDLVELPKRKKPIGCKWVFKTKRDLKGNVEKYKEHLIAKGFTQREGIDYKMIFSSVFMKDSFRNFMTLVAHFDLELHQMDVKTAFLNGDIEEEMYIVQQDSFEAKGSQHLICKLKESIYGQSKHPVNGI